MQKMTRRSVLGGAAGALPAAGYSSSLAAQVAAAAAVPASVLAALGMSEAEAAALTVPYQLFGPVPGDGYTFNYHPTGFNTLTAFTANSKTFYFNFAHPNILWAQQLFVGIPYGAGQATKLSSHSPGNHNNPTFMPQLALNQATTPIVQALGVTAEMQALRASNTEQAVTAWYQTLGQNIRLYEMRLTILWDGL